MAQVISCEVCKIFKNIFLTENFQAAAFVMCFNCPLNIKVTSTPEACNFIKKEPLARVFSREFCGISKNTFFTEHFWTSASVVNPSFLLNVYC